MKMYLVGGAVRDELRGVTPKDYDYVVVGSTHQEMQRLGFIRVHSKLPVYVHDSHPNSQFTLSHRRSDPIVDGWLTDNIETVDVSIEEDLAGRDFTVNAIAKCMDTGSLIDPFGGIADIQHRILRPVAENIFLVDPGRAYRMARFMAEWKDWRLWTESEQVFEKMSAIPSSVDWEPITTTTINLVKRGGDVHKYLEVVKKLVPFFYDKQSDDHTNFTDVYLNVDATLDLINTPEIDFEIKAALLKIAFPIVAPGVGHRVARYAKMMSDFLVLLSHYDTPVAEYNSYDVIPVTARPYVTRISDLIRYFITPPSKEKTLLLSNAVMLSKILKRHMGGRPIDNTALSKFLERINSIVETWRDFKKSVDFDVLETESAIKDIPVNILVNEIENRFILDKMGA